MTNGNTNDVIVGVYFGDFTQYVDSLVYHDQEIKLSINPESDFVFAAVDKADVPLAITALIYGSWKFRLPIFTTDADGLQSILENKPPENIKWLTKEDIKNV